MENTYLIAQIGHIFKVEYTTDSDLIVGRLGMFLVFWQFEFLFVSGFDNFFKLAWILRRAVKISKRDAQFK